MPIPVSYANCPACSVAIQWTNWRNFAIKWLFTNLWFTQFSTKCFGFCRVFQFSINSDDLFFAFEWLYWVDNYKRRLMEKKTTNDRVVKSLDSVVSIRAKSLLFQDPTLDRSVVKYFITTRICLDLVRSFFSGKAVLLTLLFVRGLHQSLIYDNTLLNSKIITPNVTKTSS